MGLPRTWRSGALSRSSAHSGHDPDVSIAAPPEYLVVAFLRDGRFRCIAAALAVLHANGHVVAGRRGTVRRSDGVAGPPDGLERVVWLALQEHVAPGALAARGPVDAALSDLRRQLRRRHLIHPLIPVRAWLPARTRDADKLLADAAARCPWPVAKAAPGTASHDAIGMPVALYGSDALRELLPAFATASGLLERSSADTLVTEENSWNDRTDYFPGI